MADSLIELQRDFAGMRDHMRSYEVVIDNEVVGQLRAGESQAFEVNPGTHELFLKIDWCRSEKRTMTLNAGETVAFRCGPNGNPYMEFYWISFGRHRYIRLSEVRPTGALSEP